MKWFEDWGIEFIPYEFNRGRGKLTIHLPNSKTKLKHLSVTFPKYKDKQMHDLYHIINAAFDQIQKDNGGYKI